MSNSKDSAVRPGADAGARLDLLATLAVVTVYLAFMLLVGFVPAWLARPAVAGGSVSIGLVLGALVTVFLVAAAWVYTRVRNRVDRNGA